MSCETFFLELFKGGLATLGPIIAGIITVWFGFRQIEGTHKSQIIAASRQVCINDLRGLVSELISLMREGQDALRQKQPMPLAGFSRYILCKTKIQLMLNPDEAETKSLLASIQTSEDLINQTPHDDSAIDAALVNVLNACGVILKNEWKRVKLGE